MIIKNWNTKLKLTGLIFVVAEQEFRIFGVTGKVQAEMTKQLQSWILYMILLKEAFTTHILI
jgi:hypothetical protein